eukprot:6457416-Amphidinium_carterae.1
MVSLSRLDEFRPVWLLMLKKATTRLRHHGFVGSEETQPFIISIGPCRGRYSCGLWQLAG